MWKRKYENNTEKWKFTVWLKYERKFCLKSKMKWNENIGSINECAIKYSIDK